jgi:protocatechuate 3,4-dioxygenase beta subunit
MVSPPGSSTEIESVEEPANPDRRRAFRAIAAALAGAPIAGALGCGSDNAPAPAAPTAPTTTSTAGSACVEAASETRGPFPDMTGMANNQAFYRQDVREGRAGLPLTLMLTIVNVRNACGPVSGAAVEIWQCDAAGWYSEYAQPGYNGTGQTFLRGLQVSNGSGQVTFTTIYPGWYQGRATHIHVDVIVNGARVKSTQIAFPEDVTRQVYATGVYASKGQNPTANANDNVFADGTSTELAVLSGDTSSGFTATLTIGVSV